ncbi:MAG: sugar phosphate isomerase/epimerase family protein [Promethearchaeota archaeon]|jgi:sugar phosphate isomerase/epimerase
MILGYSTWGMPEVPIDKALSYLSKLGFDGVEISVITGWTTELRKLDDFHRRKIIQLLKKYNLILSALAAHTDLVTKDSERYKVNKTSLKDAVDLAQYFSFEDLVPIVNTASGGSSKDWDTDLSLLVERTFELVDYAKSKDVIIGIEPHVGMMIDTPEKILRFIELIDSPFLRINLDISHFYVMGFSIEDTVSLLAPYTVNTHVKDQIGRVPNFKFLIPGEGCFDYVSYLKQLHVHGYDSFITAEVSVMVQHRVDYDPFKAADLSYKTLVKGFEKAGLSR